MKTIRVHDKAVVLILNKAEARALKQRLSFHTGIRKPKPLEKAEEKLLIELEKI